LNTRSDTFDLKGRELDVSTYYSEERLMHHRYHALSISLPAYGGLFLKHKEATI